MLEDDREKSGTGYGEYVRALWEETELIEDDFREFQLWGAGPEDLKTALFAIAREVAGTDARRDFCMRMAAEYVDGDGGEEAEALLATICGAAATDAEKRRMLAETATRILRGDMAEDGHRSPAEAGDILSQKKTDLWRAAFERLDALG